MGGEEEAEHVLECCTEAAAVRSGEMEAGGAGQLAPRQTCAVDTQAACRRHQYSQTGRQSIEGAALAASITTTSTTTTLSQQHAQPSATPTCCVCLYLYLVVRQYL